MMYVSAIISVYVNLNVMYTVTAHMSTIVYLHVWSQIVECINICHIATYFISTMCIYKYDSIHIYNILQSTILQFSIHAYWVLSPPTNSLQVKKESCFHLHRGSGHNFQHITSQRWEGFIAWYPSSGTKGAKSLGLSGKVLEGQRAEWWGEDLAEKNPPFRW